MPCFSIIGGVVSPNAIVCAKTAKLAKQIYNDWLERTYGRRDNGVGVNKIQDGEIHVGNNIYSSDVTGIPDPKYRIVYTEQYLTDLSIRLDHLQKHANDGRGIECVRAIVGALRGGRADDAKAIYYNESDKIRSHPRIRQAITSKLHIQETFG